VPLAGSATMLLVADHCPATESHASPIVLTGCAPHGRGCHS
jgi:hypothetical protein